MSAVFQRRESGGPRGASLREDSEELNAMILQKRLSEELQRQEPAFQRASRRSEELRLAQLAAANPFDLPSSPLKRSKSSGAGPAQRSPVERTSDLLAAWGAGRFNDSDDDGAFAEFFSSDMSIDASAAAHSGVAEFDVAYVGLDGAKEWFAFVGALEFEGTESSHVAGPTPGEVWLRFEAAKHTSQKTGKGAAYSAMTILSWEGDQCTKVVNVPFYPVRTAAILSVEDVRVPPMASLPAFEPHPKPMEAYAEAMARWGSGDLSKPEVFDRYVAQDALNDVADSALPSILKAYEGSAAVREWLEHVEDNWELSNMDVAPVEGLKPGCVTHRMTCDVRHKTTGKEAKGVQMYVELAYNPAGQFVYSRNYFVNAPKLASIYLSDI